MQRVGLQPARYIEATAYRTILRYRDMKCHDISISMLGYDMITTCNILTVHLITLQLTHTYTISAAVFQVKLISISL